jgi:hypothetical protein
MWLSGAPTQDGHRWDRAEADNWLKALKTWDLETGCRERLERPHKVFS